MNRRDRHQLRDALARAQYERTVRDYVALHPEWHAYTWDQLDEPGRNVWRKDVRPLYDAVVLLFAEPRPNPPPPDRPPPLPNPVIPSP